MLPGIGLSSLGDGLSTVAISWLAIELAPAATESTWVAASVAAYTLPGALGGFLLGRWMNGRNGAQLAGWDATLRAVMLLAVPLASWSGVLGLPLFVTLLALSSLLQAWGKAGRYVLLAELLPKDHLLAGNALVNILLEASYVAGPPIGALLIAWSGPELAIGTDAVTFAVLALTWRFAIPGQVRTKHIKTGASRSAGFGVIKHDPGLVGLIILTFGFFFLFGPVPVALPLYVTQVLHGSAATLAGFFTAFGIGAAAGALAAGYFKRLPLLPTSICIVLLFGIFLVPVAADLPPVAAWALFAICGFIWGPFPTTTTTLYQRSTDAENLPAVLAARGAVITLAGPAGAIAAAPLINALGPRGTLLSSAIAMVGFGCLVAVFFTVHQRRQHLDDTAATHLTGERP